MSNTSDILPSALPAHSVAEAYLYLQFAICGNCKNSPLAATGQLTRGKQFFELATRCKHCNEATNLQFDIQPEPSRQTAQSKLINPTQRPSQLIDLHGWLSMFQQILSASGREKDKAASRELIEEAAACLDEALKFFQDQADMPPDNAFFSEPGRKAFRAHPQRYARALWASRRLQLPVEPLALPSVEAPGKSWWQFWR